MKASTYKRLRNGINDRCASDADFVGDGAKIESIDGAGRGWAKVDLPQDATIRAGVAIGVKAIDGVVFGGDEDGVVNALAGNSESGDVKRLCVDVAIDGVGKKFSKGGGVDVGRRENGFIQVRAGAGVVIVIGQHVDLRKAQARQKKSRDCAQ